VTRKIKSQYQITGPLSMSVCALLSVLVKLMCLGKIKKNVYQRVHLPTTMGSNCGCLDCIPSEIMWDLWCANWHWGRKEFEYFGFFLPIIIAPTGPVSSIIRSRYNRPTNDRDAPCGLSFTPNADINGGYRQMEQISRTNVSERVYTMQI
jgi:hypothetical protein